MVLFLSMIFAIGRDPSPRAARPAPDIATRASPRGKPGPRRGRPHRCARRPFGPKAQALTPRRTRRFVAMAITDSAPAAARTAAAVSLDDRRAVRVWLFAVAALIFAMVLVGGATRLTESGLSITQWKPVTGVIPPLSDTDWQDEFARYQQIPQYAAAQSGHDARRLQDHLLVGMEPSPAGAHHRRGVHRAGAVVLASGRLRGALGQQVASRPACSRSSRSSAGGWSPRA